MDRIVRSLMRPQSMPESDLLAAFEAIRESEFVSPTPSVATIRSAISTEASRESFYASFAPLRNLLLYLDNLLGLMDQTYTCEYTVKIDEDLDFPGTCYVPLDDLLHLKDSLAKKSVAAGRLREGNKKFYDDLREKSEELAEDASEIQRISFERQWGR